ncbi:MAG: amidohydrolase family protein [Alphaproteobacteria bacterium]|nr:amidohydrolase family protein [Alphaproteobacteria bacterium]MBO4643485.1 amidohydrolase family protein [Alphaproteobacteria bacterium]
MVDDEDYGKIIEAHAHIGTWSADNVDFTEETLNDALDEPFTVSIGDEEEENEVVAILVSNMSGIDQLPDGSPKITEMEANEEMLDIASENPKYKPLIVGQPGYGDADNLVDLIERRGEEIYGIKLHPNTLQLNANDPLYEPYMAVAQAYGLPVLFHSQDNYSDPFYIYETAQKFPEVPVIMAHLGMGGDDNHWYTLGLLQTALRSGSANLYADISWLSPGMIVAILKRADDETISHLLFGTDIPLGPYSDPDAYPARVSEVKTAIAEAFEDEEEAAELIHALFYQNAYNLFFAGRDE